jgi:hypothetical protein
MITAVRFAKELPDDMIEETDNMPFEIVPKEERKSPLQSNQATRCSHDRAYTSEKFPVPGTRYICADCGLGSQWPRDLE